MLSEMTSDADPAAVVAEVERRGRRFETPCGDGALVWRAWGSGPPLLLAHGAQGAWSHWIRNIAGLSAERAVWVPDLPGYGESAMPPEPDHAAISAALAEGLRELVGPDLPIDAAGFSYGGVVAAQLAARHPDLVRRVVVVGSGGLDTPLGRVKMHPIRNLEGEARKEAHRANLLALMLHASESADDLAVHLQEINGLRSRLPPASLVLPDRLLEVLPQLQAQLDGIWGEHDYPHPAAEQEEALRRWAPDLDFRIVADAGHWAMYERPAEFNSVLLELLAQPLRAR
jgi:pimeloyl-ACP methyl ester carboxylesterase